MLRKDEDQKESAPVPAPGPGREDLPGLRATTPAERQRAFRILFACLLGLGMGQNLFFAILPPIARDLGMTEVDTSLIFSLSAFLWVLSSTFWGRRSDVIGRKRVIMIGLLGFAVSTTGFAVVVLAGLSGWVSLALVFPMLMFVRAIFGTFGSGAQPAAQAYVADRTTRSERASAVASLGAAFGIGLVVGPGFAAALAHIHILAPFFAVAGIAFASAAAIWIFLPERTPPKRKKRRWDKSLKVSMQDPRILSAMIVAVALAFSLTSVVQSLALDIVTALGLTGARAVEITGVLLMAAVGAIAAAPVWFILPMQKLSSSKPDEEEEKPKLSLLDPRVTPILIMGVVLAFSQTIAMQTVAFYFIDKLHLDSAEAAQMVGVALMAMAMATLFAQIGLIQRFNLSVQFLLRWGAGVTVVSFLLMGIGNTYGLLVAAFALAGLGFGFLRPGLQAKGSLMVSPREQGAIAGIIGSTAATGHIINPLIGMPLYQWRPEAPYFLGAGLMLCLLAYVLFHPSVRDMSDGIEEDDEPDIHVH